MKIKKIHLKFGTAIVPQISRLPQGTHFVVQDGHSKNGIRKYAAFSKKGTLILISAGRSLKEARKRTLAEYNRFLLDHNLIWGNKSPLENYVRIIQQ